MVNNIFEEIKRINEYQSEFWSSRDLAKVLGYSEYRHFLLAIKKAKETCKNSGEFIHNHFEDMDDMVKIG